MVVVAVMSTGNESVDVASLVASGTGASMTPSVILSEVVLVAVEAGISSAGLESRSRAGSELC